MAADGSVFEVIEPGLCDLVVEHFAGEIDSHENYNGKCDLTMRNGCTYSGQLKAGLFNGAGKLTWPNGVVYEGNFHVGTIEGQGYFTWPDGSTYKGAVVNGKRSGFGLYKCSAGQLYEGEWLNGLRHGKGTTSYKEQQSTTVYSGDWVKGLREGYGVMKYASGNTYEGFWRADKKNGMGLMIWKDKDNVYAGEWLDDLPHGQGETLWANVSLSKLLTKQMSSIYRGQWQSGVKHGDGAFFYSDGTQYTGQWSSDQKNGDGILVYGDGRIKPAKFEKGQNVLQQDILPPPPKSGPHGSRHGAHGQGHSAHGQGHGHSGNGNNSVAPSPSTRADEPPVEDIRLHVRDLLQSLPKANGLADPTKTFVSTSRVFVDSSTASDPTHSVVALELERLLLRFNTTLKHVYSHLVESVQKDARKIALIDSIENRAVAADFTQIDKAIATALVNHQKFFCLSLREMKTYCRELGLLGAHFTSQQVSTSLQQTIQEQKLQADYAYVLQQQLKKVAAAAAAHSSKSDTPNNTIATPIVTPHVSRPVSAMIPGAAGANANAGQIRSSAMQYVDLNRSSADILSEIEITVPHVHDIQPNNIGPTAITREAMDMDQPICEQNFFNVLIRCLSHSDIRQSSINDARVYNPNDIISTSSSSGTRVGVGMNVEGTTPRMPLPLNTSLLLAMKTINARYEHNLALPPMLAAIEHESVQAIMRQNRNLLRQWWTSCVTEAIKDGVLEAKHNGVCQLRHVIRVFLRLKGVSVRASTSTTELLRLLHAPMYSVPNMLSNSPRPQTAAVAAAAASEVGEGTAVEEQQEQAAEEKEEKEVSVPVEGTGTDTKEEKVGESEEIHANASPISTRPATAAAVPAKFDFSCLTILVDYDDFIEKVCRLILSDAWCFIDPAIALAKEAAEKAAEVAAAAAVEKGGESEEKVTEVASVAAVAVLVPEVLESDLPVEEALHKRLGVLFTNFATATATAL